MADDRWRPHRDEDDEEEEEEEIDEAASAARRDECLASDFVGSAGLQDRQRRHSLRDRSQSQHAPAPSPPGWQGCRQRCAGVGRLEMRLSSDAAAHHLEPQRHDRHLAVWNRVVQVPRGGRKRRRWSDVSALLSPSRPRHPGGDGRQGAEVHDKRRRGVP